MEREVVVLKKALIFILAIIFISTVFCYGTGTRFSLEAYYSKMALKFSEIPSIQGLIDIWDDPMVDSDAPENDSGDPLVDAVVDAFNQMASVMKGVVGSDGFFSRCWDSVVYLCSILRSVFELVPLLLPWNAVVAV